MNKPLLVCAVLSLGTFWSLHTMDMQVTSQSVLNSEQINDIFCHAVLEKNISAAQQALEQGADIKTTNPLILLFKTYYKNAVQELQANDHEFVAWLIDHGAPVNPVKGNRLHIPLVHVMKLCTLGCCFRRLLDAGAQVNKDDNEQSVMAMVMSPLCVAIQVGNPTYVQMLLERGARVNENSAIRTSPFQLALQNRLKASEMHMDARNQIVEILLSHGADPCKPDACNRTPLQLAQEKATVSSNENTKLILEPVQEYCDGPRKSLFAIGREIGDRCINMRVTKEDKK